MTNPQPVIAVFGASASLPGDDNYEAGVRCGKLLAEAGFGVATGGYGGVMEAVSRGASTAGGRVIGVTAPTVFSERPAANSHVTEELPADSLTERIHQLTDIADGTIVLFGSLGTMAELVVAWNLAFVSRFSSAAPDPVVTVGERWKTIVNMLADELETDRDLVISVDTVDEAVVAIRRALRS